MIRRLRSSPSVSALLSALMIVIAVWLLPRVGQSDPQFASGWSLLMLLLVLLIYRLRKALPFMHLAPVSSWRRTHGALGVLLPLMLLLHLDVIWPHAPLQQLLLVLLLLAIVSGLLLLWWARQMPARLTAAGGNQLLDAIPQVRAGLQAEARTMLLEVAGGPMQARYAEILAALLPGGRGRVRVPQPPPGGLSITQWRELGGLLERARQLDEQQRLQQRWRLLLTVHVMSSYVLILLALLHLLQAYRMLP